MSIDNTTLIIIILIIIIAIVFYYYTYARKYIDTVKFSDKEDDATEKYIQQEIYKYTKNPELLMPESLNILNNASPLKNHSDFARWLYPLPKTCKEDTGQCLRHEDLRYNRSGFESKSVQNQYFTSI